MGENNVANIMRCTYPDEAIWFSREHCALICDNIENLPEGYGAYLVPEGQKALCLDNPRIFSLTGYCDSGDFLRISCQGEEVFATRMMISDRPDRTLFLTEKCNSNCIMCPYGSKRRAGGQHALLNDLLQCVELMNPEAEYLCITGGEPTLLKEGFLIVLNAVKKHMPYALVHILTNGRTFFYRDFFEAYQTARPFQTLLGIPLHAADESLHDYISGVPGSFRQTVRGLDRCYNAGEHIEIRIVTSALNAHYLPTLAEFIGKHYPTISHVSLMGLEMMGNAMLHRKDVWVAFDVLMPQIERAVDILLQYGVSTRLFNYPLCKVKENYQSLYYKSISNYKIRFLPECGKCSRQDECGGFFQTTIVMPDITVKPYQ